jgi:hypothetical protein
MVYLLDYDGDGLAACSTFDRAIPGGEWQSIKLVYPANLPSTFSPHDPRAW